MLQPAQGGRAGFSYQPHSDVGTYEYPKSVDLRVPIDDYFDIYGPSSLRSANHPQEDFTYVHTFGKTERLRARKNLTKMGGPAIPGYKINDPLVLAAEDTVLYPPASDGVQHQGSIRFQEAGVPQGVSGHPSHFKSAERAGNSLQGTCTYGVPAPYAATRPNPPTQAPAASQMGSINYRIPTGLNPMFLPPPPVPTTQGEKFSAHALKAADPRAQAASLMPSSQVDVSPLWTKPVNFAPGYTGQRFAQVSPEQGCHAASAALQATEPTMTVQGEFKPFETPPNVVIPVHNPFLRDTAVGAYAQPEAGVFVPYKRPNALPGCGGGFVSLEDYLKTPWSTGVEGLGL